MTGPATTALSASLLQKDGVAHAFFTRRGGVSTGLYASLNGGVGSRDEADLVAENRRRMAAYLNVRPENLLVPYQIHSPDVAILTEPFVERPRCDALVTSRPGLALGVTGADCGMILLADMNAHVIGATHAGWKGALTGVIEATVDAMERLGARRDEILAALGPAIGQVSYEVGVEFFERFVEVSEDYARFFAPAGLAQPEEARNAVSKDEERRSRMSEGEGGSSLETGFSSPRQDEGAAFASTSNGRYLFDLPGFIALRLRLAGIEQFEDIAHDTYANPELFYSYRRSVHRGEPDYGRQVAAIALV